MTHESEQLHNESFMPEIALESDSKIKREKLVRSFRQRFKKALTAAVLPAAFLQVLSAPEKIGFPKEQVSRMLNNQVQISAYIEAAEYAAKEGEMNEEERVVAANAANEGRAVMSELGKDVTEDMLDAVTPENYGARPKQTETFFDLKDMEVEESVFRSALEKLPEGWRKNIRLVFYRDVLYDEEKAKEAAEKGGEEKEDPYGTPSKFRTSAIAYLNLENDYTDIVFYKLPWKRNEAKAIEKFYHEATHANDWRSHSRPVHERISMIYEITNRLNSPERFRSGYVESINNKNGKVELSLKILEYLPEITANYFVDKDNLPEKDIEIVERFLGKRNGKPAAGPRNRQNP